MVESDFSIKVETQAEQLQFNQAEKENIRQTELGTVNPSLFLYHSSSLAPV